MDSHFKAIPNLQRDGDNLVGAEIEEMEHEHKEHLNKFIDLRNNQHSDFTPPDEISDGEYPLDTNMRVYKNSQIDIHHSPNFSYKNRNYSSDEMNSRVEESKD